MKSFRKLALCTFSLMTLTFLTSVTPLNASCHQSERINAASQEDLVVKKCDCGKKKKKKKKKHSLNIKKI
jgi:hypothetical protein